MSYKFKDIQGKSSDELKKILYKDIIENGGNVTIDFLASEIKRIESKEQNIKMIKQNKTVVRYTKWITIMTVVMLFATIANVIIIFCKN